MSVPTPKIGFGRTVTAGIVSIAILFGALGGWASTAQISGAIIAPGQAIVRGKPQDVQHLDGGLIETIHVADGDLVARGDVLVTLDATSLTLRRDGARAELGVRLARAARLRAEETKAEAIEFTHRTRLSPARHGRVRGRRAAHLRGTCREPHCGVQALQDAPDGLARPGSAVRVTEMPSGPALDKV